AVRVLEGDSRLEPSDSVFQVIAPSAPDPIGRLVRMSARAEHVEVVASEDEHALARDVQEVAVEIDDLDQRALLAAGRVRLPGPANDASLREIHNRDQLRVLRHLLAEEVDPDREYVGLASRCSIDS